MEIPDYKPNSFKYKQEQREAQSEKRVEKIIQGNARVKKKNGSRKLADTFISEDARDLKSYVWLDLLVPAIKNTILDIIINSAELVFGQRGRKGKNRTLDRFTYSDCYTSSSRDRVTSSSRSIADFDDIILDNKGEAEEVLAQLDAMLETYKVVRVADLYDIVGVTAPHTANRYGWTNLRNAEAQRMRDGSYLLRMPRALPID